MEKSKYPEIIKELEEFKNLFIEYGIIYHNLREGGAADSDKGKLGMDLYLLREKINKKAPVIKYYFDEAGESYNLPLAGRTISLLEDVFNPVVYNVLISCGGFQLTIDTINRCIGFYEYLVETKKTINDLKTTPLIDIISSINKNLRKSFKKPPKDENELLDEIETILNNKNVKFSREKESIAYSSKSYIPDFVIKDLEAVIEGKLCNSAGDEKKIIPQINDDIVAYKTKYKNLIFIVYDVGTIRDVDKFKENIKDVPGVYIEVIKH